MKKFLLMIVSGIVLLAASYGASVAEDASPPSWTKKNTGTTIDIASFQALDGVPFAPTPSERTILVHVWATWCGPCVKEFPSFDTYANHLKELGVPVITLSVDRGGLKDVTPFVDKHPAFGHWKVLLDPDYRSGDDWHIHVLPTTLLIKDGHEVARLIGPGDWAGDEGAELNALLSGLK